MDRHRIKRTLWTGVFAVGMIGLSGRVDARAADLSEYNIPEGTKQLVLVQYKGRSRGRCRYYEKRKSGTWKKKWGCTAYVGRNGIHKTREGDGRTPSGRYALGQAFGIKKNPGTKMPYVTVNEQHYWCGDSGSKYYNRLIRRDETGHSCRGEHLIKYGGAYHYSLFIEYNKEGRAGKGSAIFLHCSRGRATAGCVAIPEKKMKRLLKRLRPDANPQIIIE